MYDLVIIGSGPAGLTSAIYMARARYKVLVIEKENNGGQITITSEVVNYPGILSTSGKELTNTMQIQAQNFGAEFTKDQIEDLIKQEDGSFIVKGKKQEYKALSVVIATGAHPRKIGFTGEKEFQGRGVAYCATCDGEFFTGKDVFVIGGGFAAVEESIFLTRYAKSVTINVRKARFSCAQSIVDELKKYDQIKVNFNTEIIEVSGDSLLQKVVFKNNQTNEITTYEAEPNDLFGVFVFAGYEPETAWLKEGHAGVSLDESGYIITDPNHQTNVEGIFAAGDVCIKNLRQVVTAVADGAIAATSAEKYAAHLHDLLKLPAFDVKRVEPRKVEAPTKNEPTNNSGSQDEGFITDQIKAQLVSLFSKFANEVTIKAEVNNSDYGREIAAFVQEFDGISENVKIQIEHVSDEPDNINVPVIKILNNIQSETGLEFHAVPGGHEFNSFIIGLYNVAGPGQKIDDDDLSLINSITSDQNVKIFVSLSCTMCPETVMSAQKIATLTDKVTVKVYDLQHYPSLKDAYQIMSVPCIIVNDHKPQFGKKNVHQFLELLTAR